MKMRILVLTEMVLLGLAMCLAFSCADNNNQDGILEGTSDGIIVTTESMGVFKGSAAVYRVVESPDAPGEALQRELSFEVAKDGEQISFVLTTIPEDPSQAIEGVVNGNTLSFNTVAAESGNFSVQLKGKGLLQGTFSSQVPDVGSLSGSIDGKWFVECYTLTNPNPSAEQDTSDNPQSYADPEGKTSFCKAVFEAISGI